MNENKFNGMNHEYVIRSPKVDKLTKTKTGGLKDLAGKCPIYLAPFKSLVEPFAWVSWKSAKENGGKYPMNNWKKGSPTKLLVSSAIRHLTAHAEGDKIDKESGLPHLYHALWNIGATIWMTKHKPELDEEKFFDGEA